MGKASEGSSKETSPFPIEKRVLVKEGEEVLISKESYVEVMPKDIEQMVLGPEGPPKDMVTFPPFMDPRSLVSVFQFLLVLSFLYIG
jgi:hypothetical protein